MATTRRCHILHTHTHAHHELLFIQFLCCCARTHPIKSTIPSHSIPLLMLSPSLFLCSVRHQQIWFIEKSVENLNFTCKLSIRNAFIDRIKCAHQTNHRVFVSFLQFIKFTTCSRALLDVYVCVRIPFRGAAFFI